MWAQERAQVSISQTTFTGNTADKETAVAVTGDAQAIIIHSNFTDNRGTAGSAVGVWAKAQARISLCVFERSNASTSGAGVQAQETSQVTRAPSEAMRL